MEIRLSVIIPIYNTASFLPRCLDSLLALHGTDLEFILVNDGSPDDSEIICQPYLKKDKRFYYYSKENGGLPSARNFGMQKAKGKYIGFLDSDDFIEPDYWDILNAAISHFGTEVIGFEHNYVKNGQIRRVSVPFPVNQVFDKKLSFNILKNSTKNQCLFFVWNKIYLREWLLHNQIWFNEGVILAEDKPFNALVFTRAKSLVYLDKPIINYVYYEKSLSQAPFKPRLLEKYEAQFHAVREVYQASGLWNKPEYAADIAQNYLGHAFLMQLNNLAHSKESFVDGLKKMRESPIYSFSFQHFRAPSDMSFYIRSLVYLFKIRQYRLIHFLFLPVIFQK